MNPFEEYKEILNKYLKPGSSQNLMKVWNEPWRKYHNIDHLVDILYRLKIFKGSVAPHHWDTLVLAAFFHDAIYYPLKKDNEDQSMTTFFRCWKGNDDWMAYYVGKMIESTKYRNVPTHFLIKLFWEADNYVFFSTKEEIIKYEEKIRKEYPMASDKDYKNGRLVFLDSCLGTMGTKADNNLKELIKFVENKY
jgi:predicted metal-dependent HD superfamily phosphohydrolase